MGEQFWALDNVSFEVKEGEVLGIIGRNGAGKSTLLKILSQVTTPTSGEIKVRGRIASLLEVGTGFHPDLTGRENVFLNGAILGMTKAEIRKKFDEIVDFSGVEEFIDTPVKRYSSGMYVRLAFAVAAHLEPEILIVDEVLAVGDAQFQKKCLGKMQEVSKGGRTVLFVSHNMQAVSTLCSHAILLNGGSIQQQGDVHNVINGYVSMAMGGAPEKREQVWNDLTMAPGNDKIRIRRIAIVPEEVDPDAVIDMQTPFRVEVDYWNLVSDTAIIVNLCLYAVDDSPVFESLTTAEPNWNNRPFPKGLFQSVCHMPKHLLNEGTYRIRILFTDNQPVKLYDYPEAVMISIADMQVRTISWYGRFIGHVHPALTWRTELLEEQNGSLPLEEQLQKPSEKSTT
jgi:lipopolysaccharide transport system ATP-binding protein